VGKSSALSQRKIKKTNIGGGKKKEKGKKRENSRDFATSIVNRDGVDGKKKLRKKRGRKREKKE